VTAAADDQAAAAARDFARAASGRWKARLGGELVGVYLLGSLAHGGFSRRYSDIDMGLIAETPLPQPVLEALRADAVAVSREMTGKLSIFWADRNLSAGRFPPLDRVDYLDHAVALIERERVALPRPALAEIRAYLAGAPLQNWRADAERFAADAALELKDHKRFLRSMLYPARFIYSWTTGRMGSNDEAVAFLIGHAPEGLDVALVGRALELRRAAADPDELFPARHSLPRQVAACVQFIAGA